MTKTAPSTPARSTPAATEARRGASKARSVPETGDVARAVAGDLAKVRSLDPVLADSALAASCLALAREIDSDTNSATSKSMCARTLLDTLDRLRELTPVQTEGDSLDDLATRRATRIAGSAAS
jgi:hypothetical protein